MYFIRAVTENKEHLYLNRRSRSSKGKPTYFIFDGIKDAPRWSSKKTASRVFKGHSKLFGDRNFEIVELNDYEYQQELLRIAAAQAIAKERS